MSNIKNVMDVTWEIITIDTLIEKNRQKKYRHVSGTEFNTEKRVRVLCERCREELIPKELKRRNHQYEAIPQVESEMLSLEDLQMKYVETFKKKLPYRYKNDTERLAKKLYMQLGRCQKSR